MPTEAGILKTLINISNKEPIYDPFESTGEQTFDASYKIILKNTIFNRVLELFSVVAKLSTTSDAGNRALYLRAYDRKDGLIGYSQIYGNVPAESTVRMTFLPGVAVASPAGSEFDYGQTGPLPVKYLCYGDYLRFTLAGYFSGDEVEWNARWRQLPCKSKA
jgi:hypothetical protein